MADCDDRQLTEQQRQAGYQNQRTGVARALRPFSGRPTIGNLLDYINRELVPAVRSTRDRLNDVYLPVVDNAPSANPLQYYFSTSTVNADPTTGFVRLDASPQNTATTIRVSETNARLGDARPWLEVMAGGATTPLGVVTLSDAVNPARFIRFDLNTMTDQGTYWDLGVTPIESSTDDPFVDGGGLVMGFIPGVASTGTTVPPGSVSPIGANTIIGNPTASTAPPTEIAIAANSILGRAGAAGTGNIESITVPGTGTLPGEVVFVQSSSLRNHVRWANFTLNALPEMLNNRFIGNVSGATARPAYLGLDLLAQDLFGIGFDAATHNFKLSDIITDHVLANISGSTATPIPIPFSSLDSTSVVYDGTSHTFQRAALTGDVTATQDSNTVTVNTSAITNAKLANMVAGTQKGRQIDAGTGVPVDLTGSEQGENIRLGLTESAAPAPGTINDQAVDARTKVYRSNPSADGDVVYTGFALGSSNTDGFFWLVKLGGDGRIVLRNEDSGSTAANRITTPLAADYILDQANSACLLLHSAGRWLVSDQQPYTASALNLTPTGAQGVIDITSLRHAGAITLQPTGAFNIDGFTAKPTGFWFDLVYRDTTTHIGTLNEETGTTAGERIRNPGNAAITFSTQESVRLRYQNTRWRVVGRSTRSFNLTDGDKGDITVSASGATWTIDNDVVSDAKLRNSAALSVIGRSANSTGDPADIAAANDAEVLRRSGTTLGFGTVATAGITDDAVTNAKLRNSSALSVIGRSVNSSGDPADIATGSGSNEVLREDGTGAIGFGTINTAGISNNAVTDAKLRDSSALSVIGRSAVSSGDPGDIVTSAGTGAVLRENGSTIGFGTVATAGIANDAITDTKIRNSVALSVIGRSANSTGDPADIAAANDGEVLRRSGTALGFGQVATAGIADGAVNNAKLRNSTALSVIGNSTNASAVPNDIQAVNDGEVLRRSGTTLGFGTVATAGIQNTAVTLAKLENRAQATFMGRQAGAGTGSPQELSAAQAADILETTVFAWSAGPQSFLAGLYNSSSTALDSYTSSSETAVTDKAIGNVFAWRLTATGGPTIVGGMVPAAGNGHFAAIINIATADFVRVLPENLTSTAANRFAFGGSAIDIQPGRGMMFWYDPVSSRWRPLSIYV